MIIIIDGYNFLKTITGSKFISDDVMRDWMGTFGRYMSYRPNSIIVVFDAGPSTHASGEWYGAVEVLYSGQHRTADDVVKAWLSKHRGLDVLLVSSDREIRDHAQNLGLVSINSQDFYRVFTDVMNRQERQMAEFQQTMHKTKPDGLYDDYLDDLMEQGSRNLISESFKSEYNEIVRVRDGKKASREDRSVSKKIDKI